MREIKFRAWDKEKNRMSNPIPIYSPFITWSDGDIDMPTDFGLVKDHRIIFMEFTGLKDKNGKDIYEGDIVAGNHRDLFLIENINGGCQMYNIKYFGQRHNELIASATCDPQTKSWLENSEIIGNIYENKDLL